MILALKGKIAHPVKAGAVSSRYGELAEALGEMGYDRRAAGEALARAEKALPGGLSGPEREKWLFKQAIVYLSGGG